MSLLEQKETISPDILDQVAKALKVPAEAIRNFSEEAAIFNIQHNYEGSNEGVTSVAVQNYNCTFNPMDKVVELYERLIKEKDAEIERLKKKEQGKN